jgi:hypothetical protein
VPSGQPHERAKTRRRRSLLRAQAAALRLPISRRRGHRHSGQTGRSNARVRQLDFRPSPSARFRVQPPLGNVSRRTTRGQCDNLEETFTDTWRLCSSFNSDRADVHRSGTSVSLKSKQSRFSTGVCSYSSLLSDREHISCHRRRTFTSSLSALQCSDCRSLNPLERHMRHLAAHACMCELAHTSFAQALYCYEAV